MEFENMLRSVINQNTPILDASIPMDHYTPLDLSVTNEALFSINITKPEECQTYITKVLQRNNARVAYGGYLEKRNLYANKTGFSGDGSPLRNIHLGIDYWSSAGTKVITPITGKVHSFKNNGTSGNYGPTIILRHTVVDDIFYTLYGHLSVASLHGLYPGRVFKKGTVLATLGTPDINVDYAPHLHFQVIRDLQGMQGDYPGVCSTKMLPFYRKNCPDPNLLLRIGV